MITKTEPGHKTYTAGAIINGTNRKDVTADFSVGNNTITYDEGPKYIKVGGARMCNWKSCRHTRGYYWENPFTTYRRWDSAGGNLECQNFPVPYLDIPWWMSPTMPSQSPLSEVVDELWGDLAGRTNQYLLSLEDFAGLFSGHSLYKGIRGVASAVNLLSKSVRDLRTLSRAFGLKAGLYNCWLSSKETVRQLLGLHLGYRFSFKTTLSDIAQSVAFADAATSCMAEITRRNQNDYMRYSKSRSYSGKQSSYYSQSEWSSLVNRAGQYWGANHMRDWFFRPSADGEGVVRNANVPAIMAMSATRSATAFAMARVRYPADYATLRHYYIGRFGLDKPLSTLWAIVPMSFVIDYLLSVQDALAYIDNALADSLVNINVGSAWVCEKTFRETSFDIPAKTFNFPFNSDPTVGITIVWPHVHTSRIWDLDFSRSPMAATSIHAQLPPLLSATDYNWVNGVGTGLELLLSKRLT